MKQRLRILYRLLTQRATKNQLGAVEQVLKGRPTMYGAYVGVGGGMELSNMSLMDCHIAGDRGPIVTGTLERFNS